MGKRLQHSDGKVLLSALETCLGAAFECKFTPPLLVETVGNYYKNFLTDPNDHQIDLTKEIKTDLMQGLERQSKAPGFYSLSEGSDTYIDRNDGYEVPLKALRNMDDKSFHKLLIDICKQYKNFATHTQTLNVKSPTLLSR